MSVFLSNVTVNFEKRHASFGAEGASLGAVSLEDHCRVLFKIRLQRQRQTGEEDREQRGDRGGHRDPRRLLRGDARPPPADRRRERRQGGRGCRFQGRRQLQGLPRRASGVSCRCSARAAKRGIVALVDGGSSPGRRVGGAFAIGSALRRASRRPRGAFSEAVGDALLRHGEELAAVESESERGLVVAQALRFARIGGSGGAWRLLRSRCQRLLLRLAQPRGDGGDRLEGVFEELALPDDAHAPSLLGEEGMLAAVALEVAGEFLLPVGRAKQGLRPFGACSAGPPHAKSFA